MKEIDKNQKKCYSIEHNDVSERMIMKKDINKKRVKRSPEEIALIKMMDNMADGKHDIMWAIILRKAIQHGVDVNVVAKDGTTPLMLAIKMHNFFVVDELLQAGAKVDVQDKKGHTPLWHAVNEKAHSQQEVINSLLRAQAPIDVESVALAFETNSEVAIELLKEVTHQVHKTDYRQIQELAKKMTVMENLKDKAINSIFNLADQGVLSEENAIEILMDEKAIRLSQKTPRTLGLDNSKQRE